MKLVLILAQALCAISICWAQSPKPQARLEAEYYVVAYAQHYRVPIALVRAIVERESNWQPCAVSPKGAAGLMQLMPLTAQRLGVRDRCRLSLSTITKNHRSRTPWPGSFGTGFTTNWSGQAALQRRASSTLWTRNTAGPSPSGFSIGRRRRLFISESSSRPAR